MPNLNKVMLMGHIVRDHEIRYTPSGMAVLNFTIAVNTHRKDKPAEAYFASIVAFDKQAETIANYTGKGDAIYIEGRLIRENWKDRDGQNREKTKIMLNGFQFIGGKKAKTVDKNTEADDDIPF